MSGEFPIHPSHHSNRVAGEAQARTKTLPAGPTPGRSVSVRLGARLVALYRRPDLRRTLVASSKNTGRVSIAPGDTSVGPAAVVRFTRGLDSEKGDLQCVR